MFMGVFIYLAIARSISLIEACICIHVHVCVCKIAKDTVVKLNMLCVVEAIASAMTRSLRQNHSAMNMYNLCPLSKDCN